MTQCQDWIHTELNEASRVLDYILSPEQKKVVLADEHTLRQELSSVIEEYAIVRPGAAANGMTLGLRNDLASILDGYQFFENAHWDEDDD